jgi:hypothetical protein
VRAPARRVPEPFTSNTDECEPPPEECPDDEVKANTDECDPPHEECPDGSAKSESGECPEPPEECPDGSVKPDSGECPEPPEECNDPSDTPPCKEEPPLPPPVDVCPLIPGDQPKGTNCDQNHNPDEDKDKDKDKDNKDRPDPNIEVDIDQDSSSGDVDNTIGVRPGDVVTAGDTTTSVSAVAAPSTVIAMVNSPTSGTRILAQPAQDTNQDGFVSASEVSAALDPASAGSVATVYRPQNAATSKPGKLPDTGGLPITSVVLIAGASLIGLGLLIVGMRRRH